MKREPDEIVLAGLSTAGSEQHRETILRGQDARAEQLAFIGPDRQQRLASGHRLPSAHT
jgi:hypothetical protein